MAVKINVDLEGVGGFTIPAGSILKYRTRVESNPTEVKFLTELYFNQAAVDNDEDPINAKSIQQTIKVPLSDPLEANPDINIVADIATLLDQIVKVQIEAIQEIVDGIITNGASEKVEINS